MIRNTIIASLLVAVFACIPAKMSAAQMIELIEVELQIQITAVDNYVHITGANGQVMHVYNVAGVRVMSVKVEGAEKRIDLNLPKGCYIVKVGKTARKISVK